LKAYLRHSLFPPKRAPGDEIWRERFLATANWLSGNFIVQRSPEGRVYGVYEYPFAWEFYDLTPPWRSGMAQGLALQVLLRAWQTTGKERYLTAAERVKQAFFVPVEAEDVTYVVAAERNDAEARLLFERGIKALERTLAYYSAPQIPWTYYDALGTVANYKYHEIHVGLTRYLYALTGSEPLRIYTTWASWETPFVMREFVRQHPNYLDLTILFLNFLFCALLLAAVRAVDRRAARLRRGAKPGSGSTRV